MLLTLAAALCCAAADWRLLQEFSDPAVGQVSAVTSVHGNTFFAISDVNASPADKTQVFQWNKDKNLFELFQVLSDDTHPSHTAELFEVDRQLYLLIGFTHFTDTANIDCYVDDDVYFAWNSPLFKYDPILEYFVFLQNVTTHGIELATAFEVNKTAYLFIGNHDSQHSPIGSEILKFNADQGVFEPFQSVFDGLGLVPSWTSFGVLGNRSILLVELVNTTSGNSTTTALALNVGESAFEVVSEIPHGHRSQFATINDEQLLCNFHVIKTYTHTNLSLQLLTLKQDGSLHVVVNQTFPPGSPLVYTWEGSTYLAVASSISRLYIFDAVSNMFQFKSEIADIPPHTDSLYFFSASSTAFLFGAPDVKENVHPHLLTWSST